MSNLSINGLSVGYMNTPLVENISIDVSPGEIAALVGPNGAGKSTILKTVSGLLKPIKGKVAIDCKDIASMSAKERAGLMSVMLTERVNTEYMTCFDIVSIGRFQYTGILGRLNKEDKEAICAAMETVKVGSLKDRDFSQISDGQKQRVLLARSIVSNPGVLIMDEPTGFLDIGFKLEFFDVLRSLAKEKQIAVLISMHEIELVKKVANKVICLTAANKIDMTGVPNEVLTNEYIEKLFSIKPGRYGEYYKEYKNR